MLPDAGVLAAGYTINLLSPASAWRMIGEVGRPGRSLTVCRAEAYADDRAAPIAIMQATIATVHRAGIDH